MAEDPNPVCSESKPQQPPAPKVEHNPRMKYDEHGVRESIEAAESEFVSRFQSDCWIWYSVFMLIGGCVTLIALAIIYHQPLVFVVVLAVVPTIVTFGLVHWLKQDTVSWALVLEMFWMGFLGAIPVAFIEGAAAWLIIENWKGADEHRAGLLVIAATLNAFIIASFLEESFKYVCITRVDNNPDETIWSRHPNMPKGILFCGLAAALGFATIENCLYVWAGLSWQVAVVRAVMAVPGHCAGGLILACGICEREFCGKQTNFGWIVLPSWLFHGFYDWFLMASAIGYEDSQQTGDTLAMAGLICAVLVDVVQFYYTWYRIDLLNRHNYSALPSKADDECDS